METILTLFRALAEPTRLRLLALCDTGEHTVSDMVNVLGQSQPRVSRHLKLLCDAGILERLPEGNFVFYRRMTTNNPATEKIINETLAELTNNPETATMDRMRLEILRKERAKVAKLYFRQNATNWNRLRSLHINETEVETALIEIFPKRKGLNLIDIGTGTGRILEILSPYVGKGMGIDQSREMLSIARAHLNQLKASNLHVRHGDMYRLPIGNSMVDVVTLHQVLHYAEDPNAVFHESARILKPGGVMIVVDFEPHDIQELRDLHAHRRLGFGQADIKTWGAAADLTMTEQRRLPGNPLTVALWRLRKNTRRQQRSRTKAQKTVPSIERRS